MTVIVELEPDTEKRLKSEARRKGVTANQFVKSVLEERFPRHPDKNGRMTRVLREMLAEGLISHIPDGVTVDDDDFEPVRISGRSLSETILEDRD